MHLMKYIFSSLGQFAQSKKKNKENKKKIKKT